MKDQSLNGMMTRIVTELATHGVSLEQARREFERQFIVASLRLHGGNLSRTAKELGVHRNTLRNKVTALGIAESAYRATGGTERELTTGARSR